MNLLFMLAGALLAFLLVGGYTGAPTLIFVAFGILAGWIGSKVIGSLGGALIDRLFDRLFASWRH